ncbi:exocyst complex component 8 isoform X2 [Acyrthosiphon pisum]|uniref:Exocyst component Exo84 C-terminal domain-containing protein n=1 Tax=Acyrthosiphon pisum TaxID=7029 RepID=A0A8R2H627_ACYPI|nr:exocyst complex component 8 isoform X2 [Acyrthosiphon pisum]|eukprot:XP_016660436.1 PREDICTED: exocyst complex component 8 isoform X2 [Acyrthosiphon pisum]
MDSLIKSVGESDYQPEKYVKELSQRCMGPEELLQQKTNVQSLGEQINTMLKKNVFYNYIQFIDTAKEIANLEGEMYQLSHLLTEQASLLNSLASSSIVSEQISKSGKEVNGVQNTEVDNVVEEKRVHKLLNIMERVENCNNDWLSKFEVAKKSQISVENKMKSSVDHKMIQRTDSIQLVHNSFEPETTEPELPEWIIDLADDLDVLIAQRHFEDANSLISKARQYLEEHGDQISTSIEQEIKTKLENRIQALTLVLTKELQVSPDKSHKGGLRAARRAVRILNQLDKSSQACDLFLKVCSNLLKSQLQYVKRDGAMSTFVKKYSMVFFGTTIEITHEFLYKAFPNSSACSSAFILWTIQEVNDFMVILNKHMFVPQTSLSNLSECIKVIHKNCQELCDYGIDLQFQIDGQLRIPLTKSINDIKDKTIEVIKIRFSEDKWKPFNLKTKQQRDKIVEEYTNYGFSNIESYNKGESWIMLTQNTITFTRTYLLLLNDCLVLYSTDLANVIDQLLYEVFAAHCNYIKSSMKNKNFVNDINIITTNARFILDIFLSHCFKVYSASTGNVNPQIHTRLKSEFGVIPTQNITGYI